MTLQEYLLVCLSEECNELAKASSKAYRFGMNGKREKGMGMVITNVQQMSIELTHILAVVDMINRHCLTSADDYTIHSHDLEAKEIKLSGYIKELVDSGKIVLKK